MKKLFLIVAILFTALPCSAADCTWNGLTATLDSTPTAAELNACIGVAETKTGDVIINIPNSTVTFSGSISVDMSSGWANVDSLTIQGENECTTTSNSNPSFDYPTSCGTDITNFVVSYYGKDGKDFRVSNMEIEGTSGAIIQGDGKSWRFDHILWTNVTGPSSNRIIWIQKGDAGEITDGLIDHCYFNGWAWGTIVHVQSTLDGGNAEWMTGAQLGTSHAVYLENNKIYSAIVGNYVTDNNGASRWVIRYNYIENAYIAGHDAQVNGFRGSLSTEFYNNVMVGGGQCFIIYRSGAVGVAYNNTATGISCGTPYAFAIYRTDGGGGWGGSVCSNSSGKSYLATTSTYPQSCSSGTGCIDIDGDSSSPDGYPCRDQPGVSGNDPQIGGGQPWLFWNNTVNGSDAGSYIGVSSYGGSYVNSGTDWCSATSTMPSTCNGVSTTYSAYTYPHPLSDEAVAVPSNAIQGVTIN